MAKTHIGLIHYGENSKGTAQCGAEDVRIISLRYFRYWKVTWNRRKITCKTCLKRCR